MTALTSLRVIELGGDVASAYCAKLLAGFGAEVLRIEHPSSRRSGPLAPADGDSADWLDTGKQRIECDDDALRALCTSADLIIDGLGAGGLEALGVDTALEQQAAAGRILLRIAPFGLHGPLATAPASDITLYAASGLMQSTGRGDREPLNAGFPLVQLGAGLRACCAVLIALHRRAGDGKGDVIEVSMQETALDTYEIALIQYLRSGKVARRNGDETRPGALAHLPLPRWLGDGGRWSHAQLAKGLHAVRGCGTRVVAAGPHGRSHRPPRRGLYAHAALAVAHRQESGLPPGPASGSGMDVSGFTGRGRQ